MSALEINTRLKALSEANRNISQLVARLSKLSTPDSQNKDLASLAENESQVRADLSTEIHQGLKELEEDFELARQEAEDLYLSSNWNAGARRSTTEKDRERITIATQVERLGEELKLARAQFRKAQLQAKRNAEAAKRREREELFAGAQEGNKSYGKRRGQEKLSEDELLLNASSDVTAALRRTHQLMSAELQKSEFAHETLQRSTAALDSLNESYSTLDTLLSSSKSLISTLVSSQKSDTWYLETAFWILVYTILWLVFRRIFYGPIRYLFFLPTKWMLNILFSILNLVAGIFAGSESVSLSSASSSLSSTSSSIAEKPKATRGTHRFNPNMPPPSVPVGAGGSGAKTGPGGETLADKVGRMAEDTRAQENAQGSEETSKEKEKEENEGEQEEEDDDGEGDQWTQGDDDEEQPRGTVLREPAAEETPNPKKRMWEEPGEEGHDEL